MNEIRIPNVPPSWIGNIICTSLESETRSRQGKVESRREAIATHTHTHTHTHTPHCRVLLLLNLKQEGKAVEF